MGTRQNLWYLSNLILSSGPLTEVLDGRKNPINILWHMTRVCFPVYISQPILKKLCEAAEMHKIQHDTGKIDPFLLHDVSSACPCATGNFFVVMIYFPTTLRVPSVSSF